MNLWHGYYHPTIGFIPLDFIPSHQTEEWLACASLDLIARSSVQHGDQRFPASSFTPMALYDATIDRMLCRETGGPSIRDHQAYDPIAKAIFERS